MKKTSLLLSICSLLFSYSIPVSAWYDSNSAGISPDWHYRVPINIPSAATQSSTIKLNIDFNNLLSTLGVSGTVDIQSPRVVRNNDTTLVNKQEFTDTIYNNVTDSANNGKGEIKFIYDDNGATTYYLYFDITANGNKPANPQPTINGNFEHSVSGSPPTQWTVATAPAGVSNENNEVHDTAAGAIYSNNAVNCGEGSISNADDSPNSGRRWHLNGYRDQCETGSLSEQIMLRKSIAIPSTNEGNLTFYFQLQAFDDVNYDHFRLRVNNTIINPTTLEIVNNALIVTASRVGRRLGFGNGLVDAGWTKATLDLSPYTGSNITIELATVFAGDNAYRTWVKFDDIEWSIKTANLGAPEKYGPLITLKKVSAIMSDPLSSANPKRIPGAIVEYTITAINSGVGIADNNTIIILDPIPVNTQFVVNSIQFNPATPINSGLTANSTNFTYSTDGGATYNSTQSTAITHFKVAPQGQFLASSGSGNPSFFVKYQVTVK